MKLLHPFGILLLLSSLFTTCSSQAIRRRGRIAKSRTYWPTEGWRTSSPEEQGMDSMRLADMLAEIRDQRHAIDSVSVVWHGYLVVAFTSQLAERDFYVPQRLLMAYMLPAVQSDAPLPQDRDGFVLLQSLSRDLASP
jgi:hypothetical protein